MQRNRTCGPSRSHRTRCRFRPGPGSVVAALALIALLSFGTGCAAGAGSASEPRELALLGSWYIVVHYQDAEPDSARAQQWEDQWEDKVWTFAYRGSRLLWTEYSLVLFEDDRGRHESLAGGRRVRSSGAWRPNPSQLAEIEAGLTVNPQWLRSKSLRGDPLRGFRSFGSNHPTSASVIGYSETWEIEDLSHRPVFRRIDQMSSGRSVALDGKTEYQSTEGGNLATGSLGKLSGSFSRDGVETGSFVMLRSGPVEFANPSEKRGANRGKNKR